MTMKDLDPQHIDDPELPAEQRAIRVAERSGMHVWALAADCQVMGLRKDLKTIDAYSVSNDPPVSATWHLHWRNPALEDPMCNDNDPQASSHHLLKQLQALTDERDMLRESCENRRQIINELQQRIQNHNEHLATRAHRYNALANVAEKYKQQLADSRAELELTQTELAAALGEGDALKSERDDWQRHYAERVKACDVRGALLVRAHAVLSYGDVGRDASLRGDIEAALEPTAETSDGAAEEAPSLERQLAQSRASVKMLQDIVRDGQAERGKLRQVCEKVNAFLWGKALQGGQEMIDALTAALHPTPEPTAKQGDTPNGG